MSLPRKVGPQSRGSTRPQAGGGGGAKPPAESGGARSRPRGRASGGGLLLFPGGQDFYAGGGGAGCVGGVSGEIGLDDVVPRGQGPHGEPCHASVVHLTHTQDRVTLLEGNGPSRRLL